MWNKKKLEETGVELERSPKKNIWCNLHSKQLHLWCHHKIQQNSYTFIYTTQLSFTSSTMQSVKQNRILLTAIFQREKSCPYSFCLAMKLGCISAKTGTFRITGTGVHRIPCQSMECHYVTLTLVCGWVQQRSLCPFPTGIIIHTNL